MTKLFFIILCALSLNVLASDSLDSNDNLRLKLKAIDPQSLNDVTITESDMAGLFKVELTTGQILYVDKEAKHIIKGNVYLNKNNILLNQTVQDSRNKNKETLNIILSKFKDSMAYYPSTALERKATVYVFSDFTCPYCKKFHNDLKLINNAGIDVYYIPFPRNALADMMVVRGLQKIICAADRAEMFNLAFKNPKPFINAVQNSEISCVNAINIMDFNNFGNTLTIKGTPTIYTEKGSVIHGYNTAVDFVTDLKNNIQEEVLWDNKD